MSKEMKQERLEKMIRDELEESGSDRQTPIQSLLGSSTTPGAPAGHTSQQDKSPRRQSPTSASGSKY